MEGTYPLRINGAEAGEVRVSEQGGWTVFNVRAQALPGIVRVSVYGAGREGYLGVLAPEGEGLALTRRLSRGALRDFPETIEYAGRAGQPCAPATEAQPQPVTEAEPEPEPKAEQLPEPEPEPPEENEAPPDMEDVYWYASPDGALVCFDGERNLIALPVGDARIPEDVRGWPKTIEGRDYLVYRTKDGRIVR